MFPCSILKWYFDNNLTTVCLHVYTGKETIADKSTIFSIQGPCNQLVLNC